MVETWSSVIFSGFLFLLAALLVMLHVRSWRLVQQQSLTDQELVFHQRQFRRRIQTSGLVGVVGLAVLCSLWVTQTVWEVVFWSALLIVVFWICGLAIADFLSIRTHFKELAQRQQQECQAQLDQLRRR